MPDPLVTIGLPTFNGATYLAETLESLLSQDFGDFELVISDNGSTDATEAICRDVASDRRVRYSRVADNRGAAWNYNRVLDIARGRYFKWAADDDICLPTFLSQCVDLLESSPGAVVAWPETFFIDEDSNEIGRLDDRNLELRDPDPVVRLAQLLRNRFEWHPVFGLFRTAMMRRTAGIGAFISADVALLGEVALMGEFAQVHEPLFLRRYHEDRSLVANPSFIEHAAWYEPAQANRRAAFPNIRLVRELLSRTAHCSLSTRDRTRASIVVIREWALPHWRHMGGEVKLAMMQPRSST